MITEAMLREAAHRASEVYTAYYEKDYDPKVPYAFPPEFEKKIDRLTHRAKHPVFYKAMRCILFFIRPCAAWHPLLLP